MSCTARCGAAAPVGYVFAGRRGFETFILPREGVHGGNNPRDPREPLHTIVAGRDSGHLVVPYLVDVNHGGADGRCYPVDEPLKTVTTKRGQSLVLPFVTKYYGTGGAVSVTSPGTSRIQTTTGSRV